MKAPSPFLSKNNLCRLAGLTVASLALGASLLAAPALPSGGAVVAGNATIASGANAVTVNQTSKAAVLSWNEFFHPGQGRRGDLRQRSSGLATLNRVTGNLPSQLDGSLTATGSVYLVNPAGVVVGATGRIQTGGSFIASTQDISNAAFLAGGDLLFSGTSDAVIVNAGKIGSLGGDVALIARRVENDGVMTAPQGTAALAAGYEVLVRDTSLSDGKFLVNVGGSGTSTTNAGVISAAVAELKANGGVMSTPSRATPPRSSRPRRSTPPEAGLFSTPARAAPSRSTAKSPRTPRPARAAPSPPPARP